MIVTFENFNQQTAVVNCLDSYMRRLTVLPEAAVDDDEYTERANIRNFKHIVTSVVNADVLKPVNFEIDDSVWECISDVLILEMQEDGDYEHDDPVVIFHRQNQQVYEQLQSDKLNAEEQQIAQENAAIVAGESDKEITLVLSLSVARMLVWSVLTIRENSVGTTNELATTFLDMNKSTVAAVLTTQSFTALTVLLNHKTAVFIMNIITGIRNMIGTDYSKSSQLDDVLRRLGVELENVLTLSNK